MPLFAHRRDAWNVYRWIQSVSSILAEPLSRTAGRWQRRCFPRNFSETTFQNAVISRQIFHNSVTRKIKNEIGSRGNKTTRVLYYTRLSGLWPVYRTFFSAAFDSRGRRNGVIILETLISEMGYLKSAGTAVIYIGLFLAVITFIPGLPPDSEFREYRYILYFIFNIY